MKRILLGLTALSICIGLAPAASAQEKPRVVGPALDGWHVVNETDEPIYTLERVPADQTKDEWTRGIVTRRIDGFGLMLTPREALEDMPSRIGRICATEAATTLEDREVDGKEAAFLRIDCPEDRSGKPISMFLVALRDPINMHIEMVTLRGEVTEEATVFAETYLADLLLCESDDTRPACRAQ